MSLSGYRMNRIAASLAKEGGARLATAMVVGSGLFGCSALLYSLFAETFWISTNVSHGQECAFVAYACGILGLLAGFAIEGAQCRHWSVALAISMFGTLLIATYFTFAWRITRDWDGVDYIIFPPVVVAVAFNVILLILLIVARIVYAVAASSAARTTAGRP